MRAHIRRILLYFVCLLVLTSCNGAALRSLRGLFKRVPTKELVRRVPKTKPQSGKKLPKWTQGIDDVVRTMSRSDSSSFSSPGVTPYYNRSTNSYNSGGNAPFKFKTVDVTITAPKVDIVPDYGGVNLNRNSGGYKPNPYMGTSSQLQLKTDLSK